MEALKAMLPSRPNRGTLKRATRAGSSAPVSSAQTSNTEANQNDSKVKQLMSQWKKLDENLASFERLEAMRGLVAKGELSAGSYDMLHDLAVTRATGKEKKQSVTGVTSMEPPIMAGYLHVRTSGKTWRKRYVLLFTERLEYHASKQESESNRGLLSAATSNPSLLVLTERFFVSQSSTRRLVNDRENSFMISDFSTTHYFAGDTKDLSQYWMHILAKTIRKIQEAKAFFEQRPKIVGRTQPSSTEEIEKEYQERLSSYQRGQSREGASSSAVDLAAQTTSSVRRPSTATTNEDRTGMRKSLRYKKEAEDLEYKRQEHSARQLQFEIQAEEAEAKAEQIQKELDQSKLVASEEERTRKEKQLKEAEELRIAMEERALLEAKMVMDYSELVEVKQQDAAEAEVEEQVKNEIKRRSVALLPLGASVETIEAMLKDQEAKKDSPETLALTQTAIEAVTRRAEDEQEERRREAEEAIAKAQETYKQAEAAKVLAETRTDKVDDALNKARALEDAEEVARKALAEKNAAMQRALVLHRQLAEHKAAVERSKQHAQARLGAAVKKPLPSQVQLEKREDPKVLAEINVLAQIVRKLGERMADGEHVQVPFGELCKAYEHAIAAKADADAEDATASGGEPSPIFDIVGLLVLGKRLEIIGYDGVNLFRGKDDDVLIRTTQTPT